MPQMYTDIEVCKKAMIAIAEEHGACTIAIYKEGDEFFGFLVEQNFRYASTKGNIVAGCSRPAIFSEWGAWQSMTNDDDPTRHDSDTESIYRLFG